MLRCRRATASRRKAVAEVGGRPAATGGSSIHGDHSAGSASEVGEAAEAASASGPAGVFSGPLKGLVGRAPGHHACKRAGIRPVRPAHSVHRRRARPLGGPPDPRAAAGDVSDSGPLHPRGRNQGRFGPNVGGAGRPVVDSGIARSHPTEPGRRSRPDEIDLLVLPARTDDVGIILHEGSAPAGRYSLYAG